MYVQVTLWKFIQGIKISKPTAVTQQVNLFKGIFDLKISTKL